MTTSVRKTALHRRIPSYCEFATHKEKTHTVVAWQRKRFRAFVIIGRALAERGSLNDR